MNARTLGRQNLLLDASNRQHTAAQRHFSRHGDALFGSLSPQGAHHGTHHGDTGRRSVLGRGALRHMQVDILFHKIPGGRLGQLRMGLDVLPGNLGAFLHHVSQVARHGQVPLSGRYLALHKEDLAAHLRPGQAGDHAHALVAGHVIVEGGGKAQVFPQMLRADDLGEVLPHGHFLGRDAGELRNLLLQAADAALMGVFVHNLLKGFVGDGELIGPQAMLRELLGNQVVVGDLKLLLGQIAGHVDHLHAVFQGGLDGANPVGRGDEQDVGEVVVHV